MIVGLNCQQQKFCQ